MMRNRRRNAFTLIEVLIVVIIMAVLAATIIPQFSSSTNDAKNSSIVFNLHTIRSQIEMYKVQHLGGLPAVATFESQMTNKTDSSGAVGTGTTHIYGPYFQGKVPANPFNGLNKVAAVTGVPTGPNEDTTAGWQYNASTGGFYPSCTTTEWDYTNDKPK